MATTLQLIGDLVRSGLHRGLSNSSRPLRRFGLRGTALKGFLKSAIVVCSPFATATYFVPACRGLYSVDFAFAVLRRISSQRFSATTRKPPRSTGWLRPTPPTVPPPRTGDARDRPLPCRSGETASPPHHCRCSRP